MKSNDQQINQDSGNTEWYTPDEIMEIVRAMLGVIELDPASNQMANERVKAGRIFTSKDDGLTQDWKAETLWLNHPFSKGEQPCKTYKSQHLIDQGLSPCKKKACVDRGYHIEKEVPSNKRWIDKLVSEFEKGHFKRGCCITFASTSEAWFKPLLDYPQIFLYGRVNFMNDKGEQIKGVTKGAVITCFGLAIEEIEKAAGDKGKVKFSSDYLNTMG